MDGYIVVDGMVMKDTKENREDAQQIIQDRRSR